MTERLPDVIFVPDAGALARVAADRILARLPGSDDILAVCLAGGSTPERLFQTLTAAPWRDAMPWNRIHWFWGDERFVLESDPRSNAGVARRLLLDRVPVPADHVFPIPTNAANETEAAGLYEKELRRFYGAERLRTGHPLFDIVLLGLGSDGHTASLFPGHPQVDETDRWVVGVPKAGLDPFVPRVTLTLPTLASTREMLFLVSGARKREILARVLAGEDLPAAHAYADGELVWLVDRAAAPPLSALQVRFPSVRRGRAERKAAGEPSVIVVMGVSGSGKSTIAAMLAMRLGWTFEDADWFHPPANIEKMHAGQPLTDEDRWPWLQGLAAWIKATRDAGGHGVIACSALKRAYRDILVAGRSDVRIVYLKGDRDLIAHRMSVRLGYFMPASLLESQFATLEEPGNDEHPIAVSIDAHPRDIVETIVRQLAIGRMSQLDGSSVRHPTRPPPGGR